MNILIVTAHPSSQGFTHRIAETYKKTAEKKGARVEILDLYKTSLQQEFLAFENPRELSNPEPTRVQMQKKISWADEIILIHPLWWFESPAILKNWFDQNFTSGFAYKYTEKTKLMPLPLLKGKIARIFITADGPTWFYWIMRPFKANWKLGRLGFCGIQTKTFRLFTEKRTKSKKQLEKWLTEVEEIAAKAS